MSGALKDEAEEALAHAQRALERLRATLGETRRRPDRRPGRGDRKTVGDHEMLSAARGEMKDAIRRRPLTALAIAFGAGLALALLTRG